MVWTQPYGLGRKKKKKRYYSVPACAGFVGPCSFPWGLQQQAVLRVVDGFDDSQKPPEATLVIQFFKGGQLTPHDVLGRADHATQQHSALCWRSCRTQWWSRLSARSTLWLEWIWLYHLKFITPPVASKLEQKQSHKDLFVTALSPPKNNLLYCLTDTANPLLFTWRVRLYLSLCTLAQPRRQPDWQHVTGKH